MQEQKLRHRNRYQKIIDQHVRKACRTHKTRFWGVECIVTPALVHEVHGDGLQIVYLSAMDTRPNYYILRIDSSINLESDEFNPEMLLQAIEDQYDNYNNYEHDYHNGNWMGKYKGDETENWENTDFPMLNCSCGCSWGQIENLSHLKKL